MSCLIILILVLFFAQSRCLLFIFALLRWNFKVTGCRIDNKANLKPLFRSWRCCILGAQPGYLWNVLIQKYFLQLNFVQRGGNSSVIQWQECFLATNKFRANFRTELECCCLKTLEDNEFLNDKNLSLKGVKLNDTLHKSPRNMCYLTIWAIPLYLVITEELKHWGSWKLTVSVVLLLTLKRTIEGASGAPEQGKKFNLLVAQQQHSL